MALTPFMNLLLPTPTVTLGPLYATENNGAFTLVDSHNHSPGFGAPIPSAALLINADLPLNGFNLTVARSLRLQTQGAPLALGTDLQCLYSTGGELYYNDGVGNQVQITIAGAIDVSTSGNISGMGATTASVAYSNSTKTFTFNQNTNQRAILDIGNVILRDPTNASVNGVTLKSPLSLSANYSITLPGGLPASQQVVTLDNSGNLAAVNPTNPNFPGKAMQEGSLNVVVSNTNASSNSLAILRGAVTSPVHIPPTLISVLAGEGFTATTSNGGGTYQIAFNSPFADQPVVTATCVEPSGLYIPVIVGNPATTAVSIQIMYLGTSPPTQASNIPVHFVAIGQRT